MIRQFIINPDFNINQLKKVNLKTFLFIQKKLNLENITILEDKDIVELQNSLLPTISPVNIIVANLIRMGAIINYKDCSKDKPSKALRKQHLKYKTNTKEYSKDCYLKSVYNITLDFFNEVLYNQHYKCAICGINQSDLDRGLMVDHDHNTGKVRGLLCHNCNAGLGHFKDNINFLDSAKNYLTIN